MAHFSWSDDLGVGNRFIDDDHKKLIKLINDFFAAMEQGRGKEVIGIVLNNLILYTGQHFGREEAEMKRIGYPEFALHRQEHEKLIQQVGELRDNFDKGNALSSITVSKFLGEWLRTHILQHDKLLAKALQAG